MALPGLRFSGAEAPQFLPHPSGAINHPGSAEQTLSPQRAQNKVRGDLESLIKVIITMQTSNMHSTKPPFLLPFSLSVTKSLLSAANKTHPERLQSHLG